MTSEMSEMFLSEKAKELLAEMNITKPEEFSEMADTLNGMEKFYSRGEVVWFELRDAFGFVSKWGKDK